jgi:GTPase SAR1 family protein
MVNSGVKVLVLGSASCGKSAIIQKFIHGTFPAEYNQTFGAELFVKTDQKKPSLNIWVTGGQERYRTLYGQFYLDAAV